MLKAVPLISKILLERVLEPVLLGCFANLLVSFILNPQAAEFILEEFIVAIIFSIPVTELNRYINCWLDKRICWTERPQRRFATHFLLISVSLIALLNSLGSVYMWFAEKGFFSLRELIIINCVTLCLAILLTLIKWTLQFYSRWKRAETEALATEQIVNELNRKFRQTENVIEVQKGIARSKLEVKCIRVAKIKAGIVLVFSDAGERTVFNGTLSELNDQLPDHIFFQVSRDTIVHREAITSTTSSTFGKIKLIIKEGDGTATASVSRPKAASFRKWYNSNSA